MEHYGTVVKVSLSSLVLRKDKVKNGKGKAKGWLNTTRT